MRSITGAIKERIQRWGKIFREAQSYYQGNLPATWAFIRDYFRVRQHTHASPIDLMHLRSFVREIHRGGLPGDIVECGSWRGGSAALMYQAAQDLGWHPDIYIYDSFEGFPKPAEEQIDGRKAQGILEGRFDWIKADEADVVKIFKALGLYSDKVHIVKGWFCDTTPHSPVREIALLHCDGDLYESTKDTLDSFYAKVVSGGFIVSNDYGEIWIGAKKAVDECIAAHCPGVAIHKIPGGGAYFRKP
jgi:O-methyltransferase